MVFGETLNMIVFAFCVLVFMELQTISKEVEPRAPNVIF